MSGLFDYSGTLIFLFCGFCTFLIGRFVVLGTAKPEQKADSAWSFKDLYAAGLILLSGGMFGILHAHHSFPGIITGVCAGQIIYQCYYPSEQVAQLVQIIGVGLEGRAPSMKLDKAVQNGVDELLAAGDSNEE